MPARARRRRRLQRQQIGCATGFGDVIKGLWTTTPGPGAAVLGRLMDRGLWRYETDAELVQAAVYGI